MSEGIPEAQGIPAGFHLLKLPRNGFVDLCGPLYGRLVEQRFTLGIRVEPRHCNPAMMCHGGMLMTLADMTMLLGSSVQGGSRRYQLTVNLGADFLVPAPLGSWLEGQVDVLRATRNLVFAQGALRIGEDLVVRINGIFKPVGEANPNFNLESLFEH